MAGQVWGTSSLGGYMYSLNLSKELRVSLRPIVKFRQFADVKDAAHQGLSKVIPSIGMCIQPLLQAVRS